MQPSDDVLEAARHVAGADTPVKPLARAAQGVAPTALLTALQFRAALGGVSERTFAGLRAKGIVGPPVELGPRTPRWTRDDLAATLSRLRRRERIAEPAHLAAARAARAGGTAPTAVDGLAAWRDLQVALTRQGFTAKLGATGAGAPTLTASRWGLSRTFDDLGEATKWARMACGTKEAADASGL